MSRGEFIERVAERGNLSKAEAKRTVDLVFGASGCRSELSAAGPCGVAGFYRRKDMGRVSTA